MPAVDVSKRPSMLRGRINLAQSAGRMVQDLAAKGRIIPARGAFPQQGSEPLTAVIYYHLYPPHGDR